MQFGTDEHMADVFGGGERTEFSQGHAACTAKTLFNQETTRTKAFMTGFAPRIFAGMGNLVASSE